MKTRFLTKKSKLIFLLFLTIGVASLNLSLWSLNSNFVLTKPIFDEVIDKEGESYLDNDMPKASEYQTYDGNGENINITLHQSILDTTTKQFTDIDSSNTFNEPFPIFSGYNTSFINTTISNINASNKTMNLELGTSQRDQVGGDFFSYSFKVRQTCLIQNFSIYISEFGGSGGSVDVKIFIYNATWNSGLSQVEPDKSTGLVDITETVPDEDSGRWYNYTVNKELDSSNTYDNTFFILFYQNTNTAVARAYYHYESGSTSDEYLTYVKFNGAGNWVEISNDISGQIILGLDDNTPVPTGINLQINGTAVTDIGATNNGYWMSTNEFEGINGILDFEITADWWEVSCDITRVQINYTKTDISAYSEFSIPASGQSVRWNVTNLGGLNYFDGRITDFNTINYTIPMIWDNPSIRVFNGATEKTTDIVKRQISEKYREIQVLYANNGTFWYLNATSSNLLSSIDTFVSGIARSIVNHSNTVRVNTTFSETIFDGLLNLSIFTPGQGYLNHTKTLDLTPLGADTTFTVSDWDVSVNVTEYGIFKIEMSWSNDTAAGFLEDYITVIADTALTLQPYPVKYAFDSGDTFNLTVFYEDTGLSLGINADSIIYQIGAGSTRPADSFYIGAGYYNITIDASDSDFNYGPNIITVSVDKTFYNNQTDEVSITILAETDAYILYPNMNEQFDSGDTINLRFYFNDTIKNVGINGATIQYRLGSASFRSDAAITDFGTGYYNISISASDADFGGYGFKNIDVNINLDYYYNQSESVTIQILGETSITAQRVPNKAYYNSEETFNISVYYEDTAKAIPITGASILIDVDGTLYPTSWFDYGDGTYQIEIDCSDAIFRPYNSNAIRVNISLTNYYNQSNTLNTIIVGNTSLTATAPATNAVFIQDQVFQISIEFTDNILSSGVDDATIDYSLNEGSSYKQTGVNPLGSGRYNITINVNDADFTQYGFVNIYINASKAFYENRSIIYTFHRQIRTQISPSNSADLGSVMKGLNVSYTFNYEEFYLSTYITEASWTQLSAPIGFTAYLQSYGNGTYTMHLDTTNVLVTGVPYVFEFSIHAIGNETQVLQLTVDVLVIQTEIVNVSWIPEIARNSGLNQSVRFYFNDTTNNIFVPDALTTDIRVKNYGTGTLFNSGEFWLYDLWDNGTYILDITMGTRTSGWYTLEVNASRFPNYNWSLYYITFYYRGNYTQANLISFSDPSGMLTPTGLSNYTIFEGSNTNIMFNLTDSEYFNSLVLGDANAYTITYINLITSASGSLTHNFVFVSQNHTGTLFTSNPSMVPGRYLINITLSKTNYEDGTLLFNLTIIERYQVNLTVVSQPVQVDAGTTFNITVRAEYYNGSAWLPLNGATISVTPYVNNIMQSLVGPLSTNSTGEIRFEITIDISAISLNLSIFLNSQYFHQEQTINVSDIEVIPFNPGFSWEDLLPYLIIIGAAVVVVGASVGVYRGVVVPKKREKQRILNEVKTIFDDAINLEHILVLYKATGTCIFFKSYGSDQIDPELIGGFLTAVSSFGKEMVAQEALNEISYGDKMLLLADGEFIRVALVLGKKASLILRKHLKDFIDTFEKVFKDVLPTWRGQLNYFRNAGEIVDDLFNTSIILPHQITYDFSNVKELKNPHSRDVLKIAHSCCEETEREFFFVATLLKDASEKTKKDTAEIFMGIKELRDKKILIPIEISAIEPQAITQQEMNLISQKVSGLTNLTNEEKQKLVSDLAQMGPMQREAYIASLISQRQIVSAPVKMKIGTTEIENRKSAKREMKELLKRAKIALGKKNRSKAVEYLQSAAIVASGWELSNDFIKIEEDIRRIKIEDLMLNKKEAEKEAKSAVKKKNYEEAAHKFKEASKIASEIFKLGATEMTKEVKRLTNKANEYEKLK